MPNLQVNKLGPSLEGMINEQIGKSLGGGLANFTTTYNANRALQKVLTDPKLKEAPVSERLEKITGALSPFGEIGQGILANRLGIEQRMMQEQENTALSNIYEKMQQGKPLDKNDYKGLSNQNLVGLIEATQKLEQEKAKAAAKPTKQSEYEKIRERDRANLLNKIENEYLNANANEGIYDQLDRLTEQTSGLEANPYSEEAAQINALGLSAIAPVLKVFNPVGAIPVQKIEMIQKKFAPTYWDLTSTKKGKIAALRFINDKARQMGSRLSELKQRYDDDIPMEELLKLQNEGTQFINALDSYDINQFGKFGEMQQQQVANDEVKVRWKGKTYAVPKNEIDSWKNAGAQIVE